MFSIQEHKIKIQWYREDKPELWPTKCRFLPLAGGEAQGGQKWFDKGVAFDSSIILVFDKLIEPRGSHDKRSGKLSANVLKALDRHPESPWQLDTGVTHYDDQGAPESHEAKAQAPPPTKKQRQAAKRAKITRTLRMRAKGTHKKVSQKLVSKLMESSSSSSEEEEPVDLTS